MTQSPYALATLADVTAPDATDSPGAQFLQCIAETLENEPELDDHEIVDAAIPVYSHELFLTLTDLCAYHEDISDADGLSLIGCAQLALEQVGSRLVAALREQAEEEAEIDDEECE